jgi:biopolymer transport protein ExbD
MKSVSPLSGGCCAATGGSAAQDLTIVPMLDVMVILAFFLIFTAVFSRTSILEVHLPEPGVASATGRARASDRAELEPSGR